MFKSLVVVALLFQLSGIVWSFIYHVQQRSVSVFFEQPNWPIYLGVTILLAAVLHSAGKKPEPVDPNKDNHFLP